MSCDSVPRPGRVGSAQLAHLARGGEVRDVEDLDRRLHRGDEVGVRVVEVVAARVDRVVVRALLDADERHRLGRERVGDLDDERAVLAGPVRLEDVEAERRGLAVARRGAVAERVRRVAGEHAARLARLAEDLHVALGDAAVVGRDGRRGGRVRDVDDLHAVLVRAGERVLAAGDLRELDVGAVVRRAAVARRIRDVLDVAHVVRVRADLGGGRGGGGQQSGEQGERKQGKESSHAGSNAPASRFLR